MRVLVQEAAEQDILSQFEWYAAQGLGDVARRFRTATYGGIEAVTAMPHAGTPRQSRNPMLAGLRSWPIKGFDELNIYYLVRSDVLIIVRILHDKRDISAVLDDQALEEP